jgi:hypothetical protein
MWTSVSGQGDMAATIRARFPAADILGLELAQAGVEIPVVKVRAPGLFSAICWISPSRTGMQGWATHAVCSEVIEHS